MGSVRETFMRKFWRVSSVMSNFDICEVVFLPAADRELPEELKCAKLSAHGRLDNAGALSRVVACGAKSLLPHEPGRPGRQYPEVFVRDDAGRGVLHVPARPGHARTGY